MTLNRWMMMVAVIVVGTVVSGCDAASDDLGFGNDAGCDAASDAASCNTGGSGTGGNGTGGNADHCGNGTCEPSKGETCSSCSADCGVCSSCGNGTCEPGETCSSCATDCGTCSSCNHNGTCEPSLGETSANCPQDCPPGGVTSKKLYHIIKIGFDVDQPVTTQLVAYAIPGGNTIETQCLMTLQGVEGDAEVWQCYFILPVGAKVQAWTYTLNSSNQPFPLNDVCDYGAASPWCAGQGTFCKGSSVFTGAQLDEWREDSPTGPLVSYGWIDNGDALGSCTSNQLFLVPN